MKYLSLLMFLFAIAPAHADEQRLPLYHGVWASPAKACALKNNPGAAMSRYWEGVFITVGRGTLEFYKSTCWITGARDEGGGRWTANLSCGGEGENYDREWKIVKHDPYSFTIADTDTRYELCR